MFVLVLMVSQLFHVFVTWQDAMRCLCLPKQTGQVGNLSCLEDPAAWAQNEDLLTSGDVDLLRKWLLL